MKLLSPKKKIRKIEKRNFCAFFLLMCSSLYIPPFSKESLISKSYNTCNLLFIKGYINQNLKLKIMGKMTRMYDGKWTEEKAQKHRDEMFEILRSK